MNIAKVNIQMPKGRWETRRFNIHVDEVLEADIEKFKGEVFKFCRRRVTSAYLFREGAKLLMSNLRAQMLKASEGTLHAKKRNAPYGVKNTRRS